MQIISQRLAAEERQRARAAWCATRLPNVSDDMSFLEMLDVVNEELIARARSPIAFDHDCREGICGMCGFMINGIPHGAAPRHHRLPAAHAPFQDGDELYLEPWRARAFPVIKDLVVDRSAFDRIIAAGGFVSVHTGGAPDGNAIPIPKQNADTAMDAAACIGCGACVAACPNASAMLFVGAKISHLGLLPARTAGARSPRPAPWSRRWTQEGFGNCTNIGECEAVCPKEITSSSSPA